MNMEYAVYLGVERYGDADVCKENIEHFRYRFRVGNDSRETIFRIRGSAGPVPEKQERYPIQNVLKEGYAYQITVFNEEITHVREIPAKEPTVYVPVVRGTPGVRTLCNFLKTALEPVGTVLYVYGGGWNWQDEGASIQARTLGVSPDWVRFFREQNACYTYKDKDDHEEMRNPATSYYPFGGYNEYYYAGLDCSGFVGWALYNTLETRDGAPGYVGPAVATGQKLETLGYGTMHRNASCTGVPEGTIFLPGDIMCTNGHVWISLGTCEDGSIVILHSTPSISREGQPGGGVQLSAVGTQQECEAMRLASKYMEQYYPEWWERYPAVLKNPQDYVSFTNPKAGRFSWNMTRSGTLPDQLSDPEGIRQKAPEQLLRHLFTSKA